MLRRAHRPIHIRLQPLEYKRHNRKLQTSTSHNICKVSEEVRNAIRFRRPVVALESTIYTHGFPYPENAALATSLESIVRLNGGIPATIGVLNGVARVGLKPDELLELASAAGNPKTMKVSRRDLGYITGMHSAGQPITGGTTISATMILAAKAGIDVFGTGGLGGVHRGGEDTMDISADLTELGRTPVCVVSSGCKSFLDIPRTLEYLETQGALVATFADGRSGDIDFPAFWTRDSGFKSPAVIQNELEAAAIIHAQKRLKLKSGILFANPIPVEYSIPKAEMDIAINAAIQEATEKGFFGHRNTPFILAKIKELTEGKSVPANRALVESNVAVATRIAVELSNLTKLADNRGAENWKGYDISKIESNEPVSTQVPSSLTDSNPSSNNVPSPEPLKPNIVVIGSIAMDLACNFSPSNSSDLSPLPHTSNPAKFESSIGGVGNNVVNAIRKIIGSDGPTVHLRSFVGNDFTGRLILNKLEHSIAGIKVLDGCRTAQYVSINDGKRDLVIAMADMSILDVDESTWDQYSEEMSHYPPPKYLVIDGNWPANIIGKCMEYGKKNGSTVIFEPVSSAKSARIFSQNTKDGKRLGIYPNHSLDISSPNEHELAAMFSAAKAAGLMESPEWFQVVDEFGIPSSGARDRLVAITNKEIVDAGIPQQTIQLLPFIPTILTKLGPSGVLLTELLGPDDKRLTSKSEAPYILSRCNNDSMMIGGVYMRHFPALPLELEEVKSVNGAGDTFLGVVVGGLARGAKLDERLINLAQTGAVMTLKSELAVSPLIKSLQMSVKSLV